MNRRKFLKYAGVFTIGLLIGKPIAIAKGKSLQILEKIKNKKYPGKVKPINENDIMKEGKWLG